jgi:undecaprenyl diphosphate synthase
MTRNNKVPVIPNHLAIIMDGNGRWAQARGLPRMAGHQAGVQAARRVVEVCGDLGIRVLTLYTFSTENWCRPPTEVAFLMKLAEGYATSELPKLQHNGVRLQHMGRREGLPDSLLRALDNAIIQTKDNTRLIINLALNYGGRVEIIDAAKEIIAAHQRNEINASELTPTSFTRYLYCPSIPDADMIVRTGGEWRLSNFILWRAVGAVFWSTPIFWPDFQREHLLETIEVYREQIK